MSSMTAATMRRQRSSAPCRCGWLCRASAALCREGDGEASGDLFAAEPAAVLRRVACVDNPGGRVEAEERAHGVEDDGTHARKSLDHNLSVAMRPRHGTSIGTRRRYAS